MAKVLDNYLGVTVFGESHGTAIGVTITGLPSGIDIDNKLIEDMLTARRAKVSAYSTPRIEEDNFEILSGVYQDKTTGEPLTAICFNKNVKSRDYAKVNTYYRPSHADYTGELRYKGYSDPGGGGHFSGRLTAPMVFAGAIAKAALKKYNVGIFAHILQIKDICDTPIESVSPEQILDISKNSLPVIDSTIIPSLDTLFNEYRQNKDSLGGIVEVAIRGVGAGIGGTHGESLESRLSSAMFAIPALKGIEFGLGFDFAHSSGKLANDPITITDGKIHTLSNNNGGILGGIASGEDIIFRIVFKPTSSIASVQTSVNRHSREVEVIEIGGRHDVCIVPRAVPVVESLAALTILDAYLEAYGYDRF